MQSCVLSAARAPVAVEGPPDPPPGPRTILPPGWPPRCRPCDGGRLVALGTMAVLACRLLLALWTWASVMAASLQGAAAGSSSSSSSSSSSAQQLLSAACPARCACFGSTVDCANRGLTRLPRGLPKDTERL